MSMSYMLYQAQRVKTGKQQREEDVQTGQLAAELGRSRRSPRRRGARTQRRLRGAARQQARPAPGVPAARPALDDRQSRV
jgi:hypothetical protein